MIKHINFFKMHFGKGSNLYRHNSQFLSTLAIYGIMVTLVSSARRSENVIFISPNYAISPIAAMELALTEEKVAATLNHLMQVQKISEKAKCNEILSKYLNKYNQDMQMQAVIRKMGIERARIIVDNGLHTFKMLHRLVNLFDSTMENECNAINTTVEDIFSKSNMQKPSMEDINDALLGILRIHYIYGFNATSQLRLGIFGETDTGISLDFDNCLSLGQKATQMEGFTLAYQWYSAAAELASSTQETDILEKALAEFQAVTNSTSLKNLHEKFQGKIQETLTGNDNYTEYAPCRGETGKGRFWQGDLYCFYHTWHPYILIGPIKTEVLSQDPVVLQFHELLGKENIQTLKDSATLDAVRTGVQPIEENGSVYGSFISSIELGLNDTIYENKPESLRKLNRKIEMVTGLDVHQDTASQTQIMLYSALGGHYDIHHDSLQTSLADLNSTGDRIATFFIILDDVKMGGYTAFPLLGTYGKPSRGSAILWFNVKRNGLPDYRTMHNGCPVVLGAKFAVRRGIFQLDNMWNYPCHLDQER